MNSSNRIGYTFNDNTTTANNVGNSPAFIGPNGSYENLVRWNFEI